MLKKEHLPPIEPAQFGAPQKQAWGVSTPPSVSEL